MSALLVGYARVSTQDQNLTAQRDALSTESSSATVAPQAPERFTFGERASIAEL